MLLDPCFAENASPDTKLHVRNVLPPSGDIEDDFKVKYEDDTQWRDQLIVSAQERRKQLVESGQRMR